MILRLAETLQTIFVNLPHQLAFPYFLLMGVKVKKVEGKKRELAIMPSIESTIFKNEEGQIKLVLPFS